MPLRTNPLTNTRGETLLEGIVSILVFTVLIATVTLLILTALRIVQRSFDENAFNQVSLESAEYPPNHQARMEEIFPQLIEYAVFNFNFNPAAPDAPYQLTINLGNVE